MTVGSLIAPFGAKTVGMVGMGALVVSLHAVHLLVGIFDTTDASSIQNDYITNVTLVYDHSKESSSPLRLSNIAFKMSRLIGKGMGVQLKSMPPTFFLFVGVVIYFVYVFTVAIRMTAVPRKLQIDFESENFDDTIAKRLRTLDLIHLIVLCTIFGCQFYITYNYDRFLAEGRGDFEYLTNVNDFLSLTSFVCFIGFLLGANYRIKTTPCYVDRGPPIINFMEDIEAQNVKQMLKPQPYKRK